MALMCGQWLPVQLPTRGTLKTNRIKLRLERCTLLFSLLARLPTGHNLAGGSAVFRHS